MQKKNLSSTHCLQCLMTKLHALAVNIFTLSEIILVPDLDVTTMDTPNLVVPMPQAPPVVDPIWIQKTTNQPPSKHRLNLQRHTCIDWCWPCNAIAWSYIHDVSAWSQSKRFTSPLSPDVLLPVLEPILDSKVIALQIQSYYWRHLHLPLTQTCGLQDPNQHHGTPLSS